MILFDDTIKNNIAYAKSSAKQDEIIKACKFSAADEFRNSFLTAMILLLVRMVLGFLEAKNKEFLLLEPC